MSVKRYLSEMPKIGVVGAGIAGCSSALALLKRIPNANLTVFSDRPFEKSTSFGPAGVFRLDYVENRKWARATFDHFTEVHRTIGGAAGIQLMSGHILSDNLELLKNQAACMSDIVFNFRWLDEREFTQFANPSKYAIHFTSFTTEGRTYVPWLVKNLKEKGAKFEVNKITSFEELGNEFDFIVNCSGFGARELAGDTGVTPNRGILFEVEAPWHKHFLYRDVTTYSIPMTNSVNVGTTKQPNDGNMNISQADRDDIWKRNLHLMPTLKGAKVISEWIGIRPDRKSVRLEKERRSTKKGKKYQIVHNYGHSSNGFTMSWGCALDVADLVAQDI